MIAGIKSYSQSYQFAKYNVDQGLPQQYVYTINQDDNGFIWIGTGDGISKFDGAEFQNYSTENGLAENFITCSAQNKKNVIWLGHNQGGISRMVDGQFKTILNDSTINSKITDIIIDQDNYVWASSQGGYLIRISPKNKIEKFDLYNNEKIINAIYGKVGSHLLVGTNEGLHFWELDNTLSPVKSVVVKQLKSKNIQCITKSKFFKNDFWIGTGESGLYQLRITDKAPNCNIRSENNAFKIGNSTVKDIIEDDNHNLLVSTFSGLFKLLFDEKEKGYKKSIVFNVNNGIENFVNTTLIDREGNTWIGMYGAGLAMLKDEIFVFYSHEDESIPNDTRSFFLDGNTKWFGLSSGLLKRNSDNEDSWTYYNARNGFKNVAVTSIIKRGKLLYLGTDGEGLYEFNTEKETFKKIYLVTSYLANSIHGLLGQGNNLWIATEGGLLKKNLIDNSVELYTTLNGLRHNSIYALSALKDGTIVLGSHSNEIIYIKRNGTFEYRLVADLNQLMDVVSVDVSKDNSLWIASLGNGVFKQVADSFVQVTTANGLKSDYCYSIVCDDRSGVWVGHRGGLSRISEESMEVEVFAGKKGLSDDFNKGAVYIDENNDVWFGTNKRAIKFNQKKFIKNTIPPLVSIKKLFLSDEEIAISNHVVVDYKAYKMKIEFIGVSFKQPDKVKYQYFLDGHDLEWSESTTSNVITYPRIADGTYKFYVKACNYDGYCSDETYGFTLTISSPFWKKWWFFIICIGLVVFFIFTIIKIREKNQKEVQRRLEKTLAIRTKEVVRKSAEIEEKNKNITDSINYAQRIQKSILPSKRLMKKYFPSSFVYYRPRDIVSGDFYWYEKVGDKFIITCADCTGHGVPGAFMSMISSTLFKEIAHQYKITDPAKFLYKLDELLNSTLKKPAKTRIHDGLDLSICVFDLKTNEMTFSGAYRPVMIYRDEKIERIKTTHFSIGGDDYVDKEFVTQKIQLNKGDIIYLFTDGMPDQFGGERGKKLYLKGFEDLIYSIVDKPMDEQHDLIGNFLEEWMGKNPQVDDILVMGIKIA